MLCLSVHSFPSHKEEHFQASCVNAAELELGWSLVGFGRVGWAGSHVRGGDDLRRLTLLKRRYWVVKPSRSKRGF